MAVSCINCGRQYDVTLFQFGRTITCACGRRVGLEHRLNLPKTGEARFFADVNVARLVRWLRAVGLDTLWEDAIPDGELVRRSLIEKRFVLTLDKRLPEEWLTDNVLLLQTEKPLGQLREVIAHFGIEKPARLFTRCLICNAALRNALSEEIAEPVPPQVLETQTDFQYCPACRKVFWEGSHTRRMRAALEELFSSV